MQPSELGIRVEQRRQPSELGIRVEKRRKELGLSQRRLAVLTGVSQGAINQLALGVTHDVRPTTLFKLAEVLEVDAKWLAFGEGA